MGDRARNLLGVLPLLLALGALGLPLASLSGCAGPRATGGAGPGRSPEPRPAPTPTAGETVAPTGGAPRAAAGPDASAPQTEGSQLGAPGADGAGAAASGAQEPPALPSGGAIVLEEPGPAGEATQWVQLLDNGDFTAPLSGRVAPEGLEPVPWWITSGGAPQLVDVAGERWLRTEGVERASQPVAAYAPLVEGLRVRGRLRGDGVLVVRDGPGGEARFALRSRGPDPLDFELTGADLRGRLGRPPVPRLELELFAGEGGPGAVWTALEVEVELPAPSAAALAAEIAAELDWILERTFALDLDRVGPRETSFLVHQHDLRTGAVLTTFFGGYHPLYDVLLEAVATDPRPTWSAVLERHVAEFLELGLHPETGLPCLWDPLEDRRVGEGYHQIARPLAFLLDLAERGPEAWRSAALAAAARAGEAVLARGVLPDGTVAPIYRPEDGEPLGDSPPLRRLDVPAQLARLGALLGDERMTQAAREALFSLEYTHVWLGEWTAIDPGFDDNYGHYGARALTMWRAHPDDEVFPRLVRSGWEHYAPHWRDALRLGANVAADQVRCWKIAGELAELAPVHAGLVDALVAAAVRTHFKGEQYGNGAWGDVTIHGFHPRANLQVGELPGVPQNLLQGLAIAYERAGAARRAELRGMFATVLRTSRVAYRREHGYQLRRTEHAGPEPSGGGIRMAVGLVEMLRALHE